MGHTEGESSAALLCVVVQTIAIIKHIIALVFNASIIQAFVSGLDLGNENSGVVLKCIFFYFRAGCSNFNVVLYVYSKVDNN